MRAVALWYVVVGAGCGTQSAGPWLLESTDCALVNTFTFDGAPTAWTDCRAYWSGTPANVLSIELTTPGTTGSFLAPGQGWARASVHVPSGEISGQLATTPYEPADVLPTAIPDASIVLDLSLPTCGNLGSSMLVTVDTMADVGAESASFSMSLGGTCYRSGGQSMYSGGFIITAAAQAGSMTDGDPGTIVGP